LTVDDLRKRMPVLPDDRNMALGLLQYGAALHDPQATQPADPKLDAIPIWGNAIAPPIGIRYPDRQLAAGRRLLAANEVEIAGIARATELETGVYPIAWKSPAVSVLLPHLSIHRGVVKVCTLAATIAAHDGRAEQCVNDLSQAAVTDSAIQNDPFFISMLVRIASQSLTRDAMLRSVALTPFDDEQL